MVYPAKTLFPGTAIGADPNLHLVGVPNNKEYTRAFFQGEYMTLKGKKVLGIRTFEDRFGRDKQYKLYYYEWKPDERQVEQEELIPFEAKVDMLLKMRDELRKRGVIK